MNALQKAGAIALLPKMSTFDSMTLAARFRKEYDEPMDWHETASLLDELNRKGLVVIIDQGYFTKYSLS